MKIKKTVCIVLISAVMMSFGGCSKTEVSESSITAETSASDTTELSKIIIDETMSVGQPETEVPRYEFNPHIYVEKFAPEIPQDYWDSFYSLCDAVRAGEPTFECSSAEAYKWATDSITLGELLPPACVKIKGISNDGTTPYENGVGRIYYQIPVEDYVARQAEFEAMVTDVLNTYLEPDDDDFEKCIKLYNYMETEYSYDYDLNYETMPDGANYLTMMSHKGQCIELASVYSYYLLQAGVEAFQVGCCEPDMAHAWTYIILDGRGYHADPTWSLKEQTGQSSLSLYYFLMDDQRRSESGCSVESLQIPLLPQYFDVKSDLDFPAHSKEYLFPPVSNLVSLDEENKILYYTAPDGDHSINY
ncbi:MAG: transglutaminase domain-containing protein [Clostridiales bacterium]|nr:transglutaminase domain-containing protein [Clostridiales bacterium]